MPLRNKFHWVATYGLVPALIALILAVVLSKGYERVTYRFLSNSPSPFVIISGLSSTTKYCVYAPTLTVGTNLILQSCGSTNNGNSENNNHGGSVTTNTTRGLFFSNSNSTIINHSPTSVPKSQGSNTPASTVGMWWNSNADGLIYSRDDPTLCLSRLSTLLTLDICVQNQTTMLWKWGSDNTLTWLYNRAKVITVQPSTPYNGATIAVLDRVANTLNQMWSLEYLTIATTVSPAVSPVLSRPRSSSPALVNDDQVPAKRTIKPTLRPTAKPSSKASSRPTAKRIIKPTLRPTAKPSRRPTAKRSIRPTLRPTAKSSSRPSRQPSWTRRNGTGWIDAFVRTDGFKSYDSSSLSIESKSSCVTCDYTNNWCKSCFYTTKMYFSLGYRYDSEYCYSHPPSYDYSSSFTTVLPSRTTTSRPRTSLPRSTMRPSRRSSSNRNYGPSSDDDSYVLIVLHSRKDQSNEFKYYQYVQKCTSSSGHLSFGLNINTVFSNWYYYFDSNLWYPKDFYPCDDDEWVLSMIDCSKTSAVGNNTEFPMSNATGNVGPTNSSYLYNTTGNVSGNTTSSLLYNCPSNFINAKILAQSNAFKIYGNPYGCNLYEDQTVCSNNAVSSAKTGGSQSNGPLVDGSIVSNIAFASNNLYNYPNYLINDIVNHLRGSFQADVWSWLGNSIPNPRDYISGGSSYNYDTYCSNTSSYNNYGRYWYSRRYNYWFGTQSYNCNQQISDTYTLIPVIGTWDDKEYGADTGKDYPCARSAQDAYVYAYSLPKSDPRHPSQLHPRKGVYSSYMYATPVGGNGIHMIYLDTRTHRSPTRKYGPTVCELENSTMLGEDQWAWFENELNRDSEIKVIGSSIPILPPIYRSDLKSYCSYDGFNGTFDKANAAVGEGPSFDGPAYDSWAEIPQERTKLLRLCQKSLNEGHTKKIVFITGNKYSTEFMAKKLPESTTHGPEQVFFELSTTLSSGNEWITKTSNSNRLHLTENMPMSRNDVTYSNQFLCRDGDYFRICSAGFRYGGLRVNWKFRTILLGVFIPSSRIEPAASVFLSF